jgi:type I restriction enzyme S subunit
MSFPRYPKYKPSGVEWLGDVPEGWDVTLAKRFITVKSGEMISAEDETEEGFPLIGGNGIRAHALKWNTLADTLVIGRVGAKCGCVHHIRENFWASEHAFRVIEKRLFAKRFFFHLLSSLGLNNFAITTAQPLLNTQIVESQWISVPPLPEQTAIAEFLDRETGKIDGLVAEQRRLMELLKEKRQAVISHAVTKGLNPHAPIKPSGIEWLGDVPEHWKVVPIKWLSPVKRGASPRPIDDPKYFDEEGEYAWVRIADVSACDGVLSETTQRLSPLGSSLSVKILPNELFVSIAGTVGKPCISAIKACIHDGFVYFPTLKINPWFLFRIFEAGDCYGGLGKWGTQLNLNTDTVGSIRIAIPPADELHQLLKFMDDESSRFDTLTAEAQRAIDLLQERRTALISAAVTGQIDVRPPPKN